MRLLVPPGLGLAAVILALTGSWPLALAALALAVAWMAAHALS